MWCSDRSTGVAIGEVKVGAVRKTLSAPIAVTNSFVIVWAQGLAPAPPCPRVDQRWLPGVPPGLGHREAGRTGCGAELKFLQRGWLQKTPDPASRTHAHSRAHTDVHYGPLERDAQARVFDGSTRSLVWILERDGGGGLAADAVASSRRRRSSRSLCSRGSLEVAAAPRCCRDEAD
jgi:hypothetical protein